MSLLISIVAFLGARELLVMVVNRGGQASGSNGWGFFGALPAAFLPLLVYLAGYQVVVPYLTLFVFVWLAVRMRFGGDLMFSGQA